MEWFDFVIDATGERRAYDVTAALYYVANKPCPRVVVSTKALWAAQGKYNELLPDHCAHVDVTQPLLMVEVPIDGTTTYFLIDGTHRLAQAVADGIDQLSAIVLSVDEAEQFRLPDSKIAFFDAWNEALQHAGGDINAAIGRLHTQGYTLDEFMAIAVAR